VSFANRVIFLNKLFYSVLALVSVICEISWSGAATGCRVNKSQTYEPIISALSQVEESPFLIACHEPPGLLIGRPPQGSSVPGNTAKFIVLVQDLALGGAGAVLTEQQRALFQKGMILENLVLRLADKRVAIPRAEIKHISHCEGSSSSQFYLGLRFDELSALGSTQIEYYILTKTIGKTPPVPKT
jgi:hypothetical protein